MKTKNFPQKKLRRKMIAMGIDINTKESISKLEIARNKRSKIYRGNL